MQRILVWLQRLVSVGLLFYLIIFHIEFKEMQSVIVKSNMTWVMAAYLFLTLSIIVSVFRWRSILNYDGQNVRVATLTKLYYIGQFYNMTLPGSLSGDMVKAYKTAGQGPESGKLAASVPMERLGGLLALVVMLMIGVFIAPISVRLRLILLATAVSIICVCTVTATEYGKRIGEYIASTSLITSRGWSNHILDLISTFRNLRRYDFVAVILAYSLVYFIISLLTLHSIGRAFGVMLPITFLLAVIPVVRLINQLPISVGGLGVRESLFVYFFGLIEISPEIAVTIGLTNYLLQAINGVAGGSFEIFDETLGV